MDPQELEKRIEEQDQKLDRIAHDIKRIKQFFMWSFIATLVTFVLPLIAAVIIIPIMISKYIDTFEGLL